MNSQRVTNSGGIGSTLLVDLPGVLYETLAPAPGALHGSGQPSRSKAQMEENRARWTAATHSPEENEARALALERLDQAGARLLAVMELAERSGLSDELKKAERANKAVTEARRRGPRAIERVIRRLEKTWDGLLEAIARLSPEPVGEDAGDEGDLMAAALDSISYGEVVRPLPSLGHDRARLRALIGRTHLDGDLGGSEAVADHFRDLFAEALGGRSMPTEVATFPATVLREFLTLGASSVRRWSKALRDAAALAQAEEHPPPADWEVLLHRQPESQIAGRRLRTPELKDEVTSLLLEDRELTGVDLAEIVSAAVSSRTISRHLREDFEPAELAMLRAGLPALEEFLWSRIGRRPRHSNDVWVMDDAHVHHDLVLPQHEGRYGDFPLDVECLVVVPAPGGHLTTKWVKELYFQVVIDAHSRLKLCTRFFPEPPTAWDTLTTIARAARRYGLPRELFTDNGGNFAAGALLQRLQAAGVMKVFSRPHNPRANGAAERFIGDLKRLMHDFPGGARKRGRWLREELWTLGELESATEDRIELRRNRRVHRTLGMTPRECYIRGGGGVALTDPKRLLQLLHVEHDVVRDADGLHTENGRYYGDCLAAVIENDLVDLYFDPLDPMHRWVARTDAGHPPGGWVGLVERVDDEAVADVGERWEAETEFLEAIAGPTVERLRRRTAVVRREEELARGMERAERDVERFAALLAEQQDRALRQLPSRRADPAPDPHFKRLW